MAKKPVSTLRDKHKKAIDKNPPNKKMSISEAMAAASGRSQEDEAKILLATIREMRTRGLSPALENFDNPLDGKGALKFIARVLMRDQDIFQNLLFGDHETLEWLRSITPPLTPEKPLDDDTDFAHLYAAAANCSYDDALSVMAKAHEIIHVDAYKKNTLYIRGIYTSMNGYMTADDPGLDALLNKTIVYQHFLFFLLLQTDPDKISKRYFHDMGLSGETFKNQLSGAILPLPPSRNVH